MKRRTRERGVAILLVMSVMAIMTVLVISLFSMGSSSQRSAGLEKAGLSANTLRDTAINLAVAQLREATSQTMPDGTPLLWTSQPGAVRVHRMDGSLQQLYKLYSAASSVSTSGDLSSDVPKAWSSSLDQFVDINAPVEISVPGSKPLVRFPIVDPRAKGSSPAATVEGFDYRADIAGVTGPGGAPDAQRLPMPVRWLYQLLDGSVGVLEDGGAFVSIGGGTPSAANPIVGRLAYWVDDESCKININTASEGVFWDVPRADTTQERLLAERQPTRREYERQPGHLAGVCLSSVLFPNRRYHPPGFSAESRDADEPMEAMSLADASALWDLGRFAAGDAPGTSRGGLARPAIRLQQGPSKDLFEGRIPPHANVADLVWEQGADAEDSAGVRSQAEFFKMHPDAATRLAAGEFFLTTQSAAPETTPFGTPRIALWPVHGATQTGEGDKDHGSPVRRATDYDHRLALMAQLGGRRYFVQRQRPTDGVWDLEKTASGGNRALFDYLKALTRRPVPGFHRPELGYGTFLEKYGDGPAGDRDAILLAMLDYVRSANFSDGGLGAETQFPILCPGNPQEGFGQVSPLSLGFNQRIKALGRILTVSEVALVVVCRAEVGADGRIQGEPSSQNRGKLLQPGDREIDVALLLEAFLPGQGWTDYFPYVSIALVGGPPGSEPDFTAPWPELKINGQPLLPVHAKPSAASAADPPADWVAWGGTLGVRSLSERVIQFRPIVVSSDSGGEENLLTFSGTMEPPNDSGRRQLKLAVYDDPGSATSGRAGRGDLLQVIPLEFPALGGPVPSSLRLPKLPDDSTAPTLEKRLRAAFRSGARLFAATDVVQSLVPAHGDLRLIAAASHLEAPSRSLPNGNHPVFVAHPLWGQSAQAHSLKEPSLDGRRKILSRAPGLADPDNPSSLGYFHDLRLAAGLTPDVPVRFNDMQQTMHAADGSSLLQLNASAAADWNRLDGMRRGAARPDVTGDFDNGVGCAPDGPYINRPDDGNLRPLTSNGLSYFTSTPNKAGCVPPVSADVFSACRQIPSAVMFGSLPTGVNAQVPWQTLLFRPHDTHFGSKSPPDHLLTEFFWQPVLEPEPLGGVLETAGKVNLNHPLAPFSYITRATALHAAMKPETLMAIPDTASKSYKNGTEPDNRFRHYLDAGATLRLWHENIFSQGKVFLAASEICAQYLIPEGLGTKGTAATMKDFWNRHRLTGDNSKERPYAHLLPRFTTRSNVFRIHFIVETIQKARTSDHVRFDPAKDKITASQRGSCLIRRWLQTEDADLPDYTKAADAPPLSEFYRWRTEAFTRFP